MSDILGRVSSLERGGRRPDSAGFAGDDPLRASRRRPGHRLGLGRRADWPRTGTPTRPPTSRRLFRNTTFDNRGIGTTRCAAPAPWSLEDFALDTAELIKAVCDPPVALVGLSFGAGIVQQVALDFPDLLRCAIAMGTGARSIGWTWDYQMAEIEFRKAGGRPRRDDGRRPLRGNVLSGAGAR